MSDRPAMSDNAPKTLAEAAYLKLRQDILSGKLKPGTRLRFAEIAKDYEAGISTLREALSRLTSDRLVIAEGQRGFGVSPISLNELWDITRLRSDLESAALEEAIEVGTDAWEGDVLSYLHRLLKLERREGSIPPLLTEEGAQLHKLFHMSLISPCPSVWRLRVIDVLYDHSERYRRLQTSYHSSVLHSADEHESIAMAVIARDSARATAMLKQHLERTAEMLASIKDLWSEAVEPASMTA